jgi:hypothetical protein
VSARRLQVDVCFLLGFLPSPEVFSSCKKAADKKAADGAPSGVSERGKTIMNWKSKLVLGILTAVAMYLLTFLLPRGGTLRDTALVQFPLTVGVWAIFVLLFVKLK